MNMLDVHITFKEKEDSDNFTNLTHKECLLITETITDFVYQQIMSYPDNTPPCGEHQIPIAFDTLVYMLQFEIHFHPPLPVMIFIQEFKPISFEDKMERDLQGLFSDLTKMNIHCNQNPISDELN